MIICNEVYVVFMKILQALPVLASATFIIATQNQTDFQGSNHIFLLRDTNFSFEASSLTQSTYGDPVFALFQDRAVSASENGLDSSNELNILNDQGMRLLETLSKSSHLKEHEESLKQFIGNVCKSNLTQLQWVSL